MENLFEETRDYKSKLCDKYTNMHECGVIHTHTHTHIIIYIKYTVFCKQILVNKIKHTFNNTLRHDLRQNWKQFRLNYVLLKQK